jgi:plastocyanin domain-containing protein
MTWIPSEGMSGERIERELARRARAVADTDDPYYCPHCGVSPCAHLTEDCG